LVVAEKKVKSILNKMTKETFDRLSAQMLEIPILSYEILTMMIDTVYDKAIDEPSFGDMYADLCVRLSQSVQGNKFVHIIESDEEPPTEDGEAAPDPNDGSTQNTVYRWSNDVSTSDSEIVGPLPSVEACFDAAFDEEERTPTERGELELELVSVSIKRGIFIKIMKRQRAKEGEDSYYTVYFPASEAKECGQQLSEIFLSEVECQADAAKKNTFKRSLLNKCEEEFNKQDIYEGWKKEQKEYEESKSTLTEAARAEKEEELSFRRIRIKKQMLGNVKFIGQLYKVNLLKEKIMRYCISSLLKLEEIDTIKSKNPEYKDSGKTDMDEEDHEAICNMFITIGSTIDKPHAADFMNVAFSKIERLSVSKDLPSRSRFMYKDLLELRANEWVPRRKEEKAKTIAEIRKDVELEERRQAQQSRTVGKGGNDFRNSGRGTSGDYRARQSVTSSSRIRSKPTSQTDEDGFVTVTGSSKPPPSLASKGAPSSPVKTSLGRSVDAVSSGTKPMFAALADEPASSRPDTLSTEELKKKIKSMGTDFISNGENVEELLLSWEEISATTDAGKLLVMKNVDRLVDCKVNELKAIIRIIIVLCEKAKLSKTDVQQGLMEAIEFIDSIAIDSPRVYEDFGFLLGDLLRIKMIEMSWLCEQLEKAKSADSNSKAPEKVLRYALVSLKQSAGVDFARSELQDTKLTGLLDAASIDSLSCAL
jgi:translation initiation factor 4G